jgi:hypothetical protein
MTQVAPGCFFTPEEDTPINPTVGKKTYVPTNTPKLYYKRVEVRKEEREVITPNGFAVSIAFNKGGYMVIPKEDL